MKIHIFSGLFKHINQKKLVRFQFKSKIKRGEVWMRETSEGRSTPTDRSEILKRRKKTLCGINFYDFIIQTMFKSQLLFSSLLASNDDIKLARTGCVCAVLMEIVMMLSTHYGRSSIEK